MRAYRVTVDGRARYAGTQADAFAAELIAFINELIKERGSGSQDD